VAKSERVDGGKVVEMAIVAKDVNMTSEPVAAIFVTVDGV
jgi:hypothetical protein